jgi:hypothetical protein
MFQVYGSSDGGHLINAEDNQMNAIMKAAANYIGIKGHVVGAIEKKKLYA